MEKENRDCFVKVRLTKSEKDQVNTYCEKHQMSVSEFMRLAMINQIAKEDK